VESHSVYEKGVVGKRGPSHNTRSENVLVVPRGKHSTTAAAEQAESSEQSGTIHEEHWRARDSTSWSVPGGDLFHRAGFMTALLYSVWDGVLSGRLSTGAAFGLIAAFPVATSAESIISCPSLCGFLAKYWYMRGLHNNTVGFSHRDVRTSTISVLRETAYVSSGLSRLHRQ
jgi:hypothetical protein